MITEKELQNKIIKLLKDERFYESINKIETVDEALNVNSDENHIPHLSIDDLLRKKYSKACSLVLNSIDECEIITGDIIKDISLSSDEKLFPDFILFNRDTAQVILIEIKVSSKTGREAITEIFGYINEIRNHLPFTSHYDISAIIISPIFDTLLDHSISSNILSSNINLLCLAPNFQGNNLTFDIHFPKSWTNIGQNNLPENGLVSYSWGLKKKELGYHFDEMSILNLARELILANANRYNSSGFLLIWENGFFECTESKYVITNYVVNPFAFLPNADKYGFEYKKTILANHLKNYSEQYGGLVHPKSLFKIMDEASVFLKEYFYIEIDSASDWTSDFKNEDYRLQRKPIYFDSWGLIGDYVRFFYFHPAVRKHYFDKQSDNYLGHMTPVIGLQIINIITNNTILNNGHLYSRDLFEFGKQLALYNQACYIASKSSHSVKSAALLFWSVLEISQSLREIKFYAQNTKEINTEIDLNLFLTLNPANVRDAFKETSDIFANNFQAIFLPGPENSKFRSIFDFGYKYGVYFSDLWKSHLLKSDLANIESEIGNFTRNHLNAIAHSVKNNERKLNRKELLFFANHISKINIHTDSIDMIAKKISGISNLIYSSIFRDFLESFSVTLGIPYRELEEFIIPKSVDWKWMKESLGRQFRQGYKHGSVNLEPNGNISISQVEEEYRILKELENEDEVYLKTYAFTTLYIYRKVFWKDIMSGAAFI